MTTRESPLDIARVMVVQGSFGMFLGTMDDGEQALQIAVVRGWGHDALDGSTGVFDLTVDDDGTHSYELVYRM